MLTGITVICFAPCYAIAFALESLGIKRRFSWHRAALLVAVVAGLVAHSIYLSNRAAAAVGSPLSSPADWLQLAAWALALAYLSAIVNLPRAPTGLILLPLILALLGASLYASRAPFAPEQASRFWGDFHGWMLVLGTVTVCIGFAAGIMYLAQSYGLKRRRPPSATFRLPSLEWLERTITGSLALSMLLVGLGFASGLVLSLLKHRGESDYSLWTDPVVVSLGTMLAWLVAAETFRLVYPAARRGRKVAYLTLASFVFLVIALASLMLLDNLHGAHPPNAHGEQTAILKILTQPPADPLPETVAFGCAAVRRRAKHASYRLPETDGSQPTDRQHESGEHLASNDHALAQRRIAGQIVVTKKQIAR